MHAGEGPYRTFRIDVNALKNNNKTSLLCSPSITGVIHEVGQEACTNAVTYP